MTTTILPVDEMTGARLRTDDPTPEEAAREQSALDAPVGEVLYVGRRNGGEATVSIEAPGTHVPLPHLVRHSPAGFEWGYGGSGPADLARSMLAHALGDRAACPTCRGARKIVWLPDQEDPVPFDPEQHVDLPTAIDAVVIDGDEPVAFVEQCYDCDDGIRADLPYMDFKFVVIADLPREGWALSRKAVLDWFEHRAVTS